MVDNPKDTKSETAAPGESGKEVSGLPTAGTGTLDFGKFAPLPWRAHDTQDSRGWVIRDAQDRTVAIMGNYVPTQVAAETIVSVINAWASSEVRRLELALAARRQP